MIPLRTYDGKKIAVFGLARSGLAAVEALLEGGASVVAWDDNEDQRRRAADLGASIADLYKEDWASIDACVLSPGIPLTHPAPHAIVLMAQENKVDVIGDLELFERERASSSSAPNLVCLTGTNGKSTTTSLVGHMLKEAGIPTEVGGNIGEPALALPEFRNARQTYVLEVSSYQLDLTPNLKPNTAVLLNISADHLDRHGGMDGYVASKRKIFSHQSADDTAVISVDDPHSAEICTDLSRLGTGTVVPISVGKTLSKGVFVVDGILFDGLETPSVEVLDLHECPSLLGEHNWQNAAAAYAVARAQNVARDVIVRSLKSFRGLAHRMENVGQIGQVKFVNDSKATNVDAARHALSSFEDIYWIVGGRSKTNSLSGLESLMPRVKHAYLIGESADAFSRALAGKTSNIISGDLSSAVVTAYRDAVRENSKDPVVLLSPACASFDQFKDFEARGDHFRKIVEQLIDQETGGAAA